MTCPSLTSPPNADVRHPIGTEYQSTALYTCDSGYERGSGDLARTCGADGTWSGSEPVCAGEIASENALDFNQQAMDACIQKGCMFDLKWALYSCCYDTHDCLT